jgi:hypothetical protein
VVRTRKSGEVEYIPSGINHQLTNSSKSPERLLLSSSTRGCLDE